MTTFYKIVTHIIFPAKIVYQSLAFCSGFREYVVIRPKWGWSSVKYRQICLLTAIGLTPGGSSIVHSYTQTAHRTTQLVWEGCGHCAVFASYTLVFALELRKMHGKPSVRVAEDCQLAR